MAGAARRNISLVVICAAWVTIVLVAVPLIVGQLQTQAAPSEGKGPGVSLSAARSSYGFILNLRANATSITPYQHVNLTFWISNPTPEAIIVPAIASWRLGNYSDWTFGGPTSMFPGVCALGHGWFTGIILLQGAYSTYGAAEASPSSWVEIQDHDPMFCPPAPQPSHFSFPPYSSAFQRETSHWTNSTTTSRSFVFGNDQLRHPPLGPGIRLPGLEPGVYTAAASDEWGDVATVQFTVHP